MVIAFELIHSTNRKNNGVKGWMAMKLDMSKAYDRVEWFFVKDDGEIGLCSKVV